MHQHRQRPKLRPNAVPTIFGATSRGYLRQYRPLAAVQKTCVTSDCESLIGDDYDLTDLALNHLLKQKLTSDRIGSFEELKCYVGENNVRSDLNWQRVCTDDTICFFVVNCEERPYLEVSIKIANDLSVKGWKGNVMIKRSLLKQILGPTVKCDQYTKLMNMLGVLRSRATYNELAILKVANVSGYYEDAAHDAKTQILNDYANEYCPISECETIILD